jgi:hypothetical protein
VYLGGGGEGFWLVTTTGLLPRGTVAAVVVFGTVVFGTKSSSVDSPPVAVEEPGRWWALFTLLFFRAWAVVVGAGLRLLSLS